ncbi:hypothetical protein J7T55_006111 [Diaporthe amygdali]|uniref:uncharacterized protein n=1 Tax=Phomopsis amygdali TaxID=1214568 RepID=UPI0022FE6102|nr:uncharacterized protein J7T55_006111 [Diaporthe amygdali]KAJ0124770.1 hypothetical protein J7T55_006111 [Diaporthe amygdali]
MEDPADHDETYRIGDVAVDFGSTATRVVVVVTEINRITKTRRIVDKLQIQDTRACDDSGRRFERGEFPSLACPFDGPPFLFGYDAAEQATKRRTSMKSFPYFRSQLCHPYTAELFEHWSSLESEIAKQEFNDTLDGILLGFFTDIVNKTLTKGLEEEFEIRTIALCIPNAWSARENKIQEYLSPILDKTVAGKNIEFTFMFEAAARAQYLLSRYSRQLKNYNYLMVLDFGGHFMGGADGALVWRSDGRPAFFSPKESDFGQKGGYALWELEIGKVIDEQMTKDWNARARFPEKHRGMIRTAFLDKFFQEKANVLSDKPRFFQGKEEFPSNRPPFRLTIDLSNTPTDLEKHTFSINIPVEKLQTGWEKAYRGILDLAKSNINRAAEKGENVYVLLAGGSISNLKARSEMQDFGNNRGRLWSQRTTKGSITMRIMEDIQAVGWKWTAAEGAADCLANTMDVEEYFDKGAPLAVQMTTPKGNFTAHTSGTAKVLFCKTKGVERRHVVEVNIKDQRSFQLISDPIHDTKKEDLMALEVLSEICYDIWEITLDLEPTTGTKPPRRIPDGKYVLDVFDMEYAGRDAVVVLRLRRRLPPVGRAALRSKALSKRGASLEEGGSLYLELPLVSDEGSNLVVLDIDLIKGRVWKSMRSVKGQIDADAEAGPDLRSDSEKNISVKQRKRTFNNGSDNRMAKRLKQLKRGED